MSETEEFRFTLKVLINKQKTKVLFAEVDSDFADVLLSFLTLPLGTLVRLLEKHYGDEAPILGCLSTLYKGVENLDNLCLSTDAAKFMLLNTRCSLPAECNELKLKIDDTPPIKYFTCVSHNSTNVCFYHPAICRQCGNITNKELFMIEQINIFKLQDDDGVFTKKMVPFLLTDDFQLLPNVTQSIMHNILTLCSIDDIDGAEQVYVTVGINEIMDLLRGSLMSKNPLTDFIVSHQPHMHYSGTRVKTDLLQLTSPLKIKTEDTSSSTPKRITVKAMIRKSTKKLLFAQAEEDFVNFLFSFLTIPLGQVECLLSNNASFGSIDNLYRSLSNLNGQKYLKTSYTKDKLLRHKLPPYYLLKTSIFSLDEETTPQLFYKESREKSVDCLSTCGYKSYGYRTSRASFVDPKGQGSYVKEGRMYMVTDDLTVTPLLVLSCLSTLKELKIPLSDIEELDLNIGLEEGLSILRASLSSAHALTNGLNLFMGKQLKLEH